jgi:Leucine-rich repeat (LRR) protein
MKQFITLLFLALFALNFAQAQQEATKEKSIKTAQQSQEQEKLHFEKPPRQEGDRLNSSAEKLMRKRYKEIRKQRSKTHSNTKESNSCSEEDSLALVAIYKEMNGENWTNQDNWLTEAPVKNWWGITVADNRVKEIDFLIDHDTTQNVSGTFPEEFWQLTGLTSFDLRYNNIEDSISSKIKNLTELRYILLGHNKLKGSIPEEIENLSDLEWLWLHCNQLEDTIPKELNKLSNLTALILSFNQFEELPDLSGLENMNFCWISNNLFDFKDLETANINWDNSSDYNYAPQNTKLPLNIDTTSNEVTLSVIAESPSNSYQWIKGEDTLTAETDSTLTYQKDDTSSYYCEVTNSSFPDLTLETETFAYIEHTLTFNVTDDSSNAIKGATISIEGKIDKTTNTNGKAAFELLNGKYNYTINAAGYEDATGSVLIDSANTTEYVALTDATYNLSFNISDENSNKIDGATINIEGVGDKTTDTTGTAVFNLPNDNYNYTVTAAGYEDTTGSVLIDCAGTTENVTLTETTFNLSFEVTNNSSEPIKGATVSITDKNDKTTDSNGEAVFELPDGNYEYTITATGYEDTTGTVAVDSENITEEVALAEVSTSINLSRGSNTEIYPNPASDKITIESDKEIKATKVVNLMGKVVVSEHPKAKKTTIDISNLNNGVYLLEINYRKGLTDTKRIMIR